MERNGVMARKIAVTKKKCWMPLTLPLDSRRTRTGEAMAPSPQATLSRAMSLARAAGTTVPAMTLPAVSPAPRPKPMQKMAIYASPKLVQAMATHPAAVMAEP